MTIAAGLAERLGHGGDARLLIVNADDFGTHHGANVAIIDGFRSGSVTSTSLMVPCPWAPGAALDAAAAVADGVVMDVGVHLTLTSEWPTYRWASITGTPVLHASDGRMHRTHADFHAAVAAAGEAGLAAVRTECIAQIELAMAWGIDVTHIDGHMGVVNSTSMLNGLVLDLAAQFDLPMRMMARSAEQRLGFELRGPATDRGVLFPDWFVDTYLDARSVHDRVLPALRAGVTEIVLHPAVDSADLHAAFDDATERVANHAFTNADGGLMELVRSHQIVTIGYRALRDLQRAARV